MFQLTVEHKVDVIFTCPLMRVSKFACLNCEYHTFVEQIFERIPLNVSEHKVVSLYLI